jgi:hypothetical protein
VLHDIHQLLHVLFDGQVLFLIFSFFHFFQEYHTAPTRTLNRLVHLRSTKPLRLDVVLCTCSGALTLCTLHTVLGSTRTIVFDPDVHVRSRERVEERLSFMLDPDWKCAYGARATTV